MQLKNQCEILSTNPNYQSYINIINNIHTNIVTIAEYFFKIQAKQLLTEDEIKNIKEITKVMINIKIDDDEEEEEDNYKKVIQNIINEFNNILFIICLYYFYIKRKLDKDDKEVLNKIATKLNEENENDKNAKFLDQIRTILNPAGARYNQYCYKS